MNVIPKFYKMRLELNYNEEVESTDKENFDPTSKKFSPMKTKPKKRINILKEITEKNKKKGPGRERTQETKETEIDNLFLSFNSPLKKPRHTREM